MNANDFRQNAFAPLGDTCQRQMNRVLAQVDPDREVRLLDVGCGAGEQLFRLAEALPKAQLTGIDISAPSIARARERLRKSPHRHRLRFEVVDYLDFQGETFDLIVAWCVLHYIRGPDAVVFRKLADNLTDDGVLLYTMPYRCFSNGALWMVRRAFAAVRGPLTDGLVMRAGRRLCGPGFPEERLRERLCYMYQIPIRVDRPTLRSYLTGELGLEQISDEEEPHVSIAQPKTRLVALRKSARRSNRAA